LYVGEWLEANRTLACSSDIGRSSIDKKNQRREFSHDCFAGCLGLSRYCSDSESSLSRNVLVSRGSLRLDGAMTDGVLRRARGTDRALLL
jgi:hypothetical protein